MAEINLGKVTGTVSKENIEDVLGFSIKDMVILSQREYERLPISEQNSGNLFFIKDFRGKVVHMNKSIWQPSIPSYYKDLTDDLFNESGSLIRDENGDLLYPYLTILPQINGEDAKDFDFEGFINKDSLKGVATKGDFLTGCNNLFFIDDGDIPWTSLDFSCVDTSNVTSFGAMFGGCSLVENFDTSTLITDKAENVFSMFSSCVSVKKLNLVNFNTENVTDMGSMFSGCEALQHIELSSFNTDKVSDMRYMFRDCISLVELDLSSFNTTLAHSTLVSSDRHGLDDIFYGCTALQTVYVRTEQDGDNLRNSKNCPEGIEFIVKIPPNMIFFADPLVGQTLFDKGLITDPTYSTKEKLAEITNYDLNGNVDAYEFDPGDGYAIFYYSEITKIPELPYFTGITEMIGTFNSCFNLAEAPTIPDSVTNMVGAFYDCNLTEAPVIPNSVTNLSYAFSNCTSLNGKFIIEAVTPPTINQYTFDNVNVISIKVPASSVQAYKTASGWSDFADKIFPI